MMAPHTVRSRLGSVPTSALKVPAFLVIDALQHSTPDVQIEALALTLAAMCRSMGVDPHERVTQANRRLAEADTVKNPHIEAIAAYAAGELRG